MLNSKQKSDKEVMKHMCKLCNKSFPCGRSLGGHMRSHVINSTDHHHQNMKQSSLCNKGGNLMINGSSSSNELGYELRKDPKKTLKAVTNSASGLNDCVGFDKLCKECGKGFQSWKALFGHMKCHSDKVSNTKTMICEQDQEMENSGPESGQMRKSRSRNGANKRSMVTSTSITTTTTITNNTASSSVSMNANHTSTSVVSDIYDEQEADIAMCLIMLSRDEGEWDRKMKKLKKTSDNADQIDDQNKRRFECATCNKSFHSYQALGGHKASHKKLKGCFDLEYIDKEAIKSEPMLDHDNITNGCCEKTSNEDESASSFNIGSLKNTRVLGAYECSICLKVFSSGQALGGHKRSHLIAEAKLKQHNLNMIEKFDKPVCEEVRGFLDLNMPPDDHVEDEEQQETMMNNTSSKGTGYNPWCYNHESTPFGLLSTS